MLLDFSNGLSLFTCPAKANGEVGNNFASFSQLRWCWIRKVNAVIHSDMAGT